MSDDHFSTNRSPLLDQFLRTLTHKSDGLASLRPTDEYDGECDDDDDDEHDDDQATGMGLDVLTLTATALLARAIDRQPELRQAIETSCLILLVEAFAPDIVEPVGNVLEKCLLGIRGGRGARNVDRLYSSAVSYVLLTGEGITLRSGTRLIADAMRAKVPLIAVTSATDYAFGKLLARGADWRLPIDPIDKDSLTFVLEAFTGTQLTVPVEDAVLRTLTASDLVLHCRSDLSADECLRRLGQGAGGHGSDVSERPTLLELPGYGQAAQWGLELAADMADYRAGRIAWEQMDHRALLLSGPPGVGKTSYAKALARTAQLPLIATSVATWNSEKYMSGTMKMMRDCFSEAKSKAPSILFIDEVDGIGDRSRMQGDHALYWQQIANLFLELLAGADEMIGVVVVAATNHPQVIDPAVLRAGRLDTHIAIEKPDAEERAGIFRLYLGDTVAVRDCTELGLAAVDATGADIDAFVRRAQATARRARRPIRASDVMEQINAGAGQMSAETRRIVSVHEAGHVVVASILGHGSIKAVSIHGGGGTTEMNHQLDGTATLDHFRDVLAMLMGGRAAEELVFGKICAGSAGNASSDLGKATHIARMIELRLGFGGLGAIYLEDQDPLVGHMPGLAASILGRLNEAMARASSILIEHRDVLDRVAARLFREGYVSGADIRKLIGATAERTAA